MTSADRPSSGVPRIPASGGFAQRDEIKTATSVDGGPPAAIDRDLFAVYFGPNAGSFLATLDKMYAASPTLNRPLTSWSWPAFLVTLPWLLYRKRWIEAAVVILVPLVLFYLFPSANGGGVAIAVVAGMQAKSWYAMSAASRIRSIQREEPDPRRARERIARAGGVSVPGAIIGGVIFAVAVAAALALLID